MRDYLPAPVPQGTAIESYRALRIALTGEPMPVLTRNTSVIRFLAGLLANHMCGTLVYGGWDEAAAEAKILEHVDEWLASLILGETPAGDPVLMDPAEWKALPQD